MICAFEVALLEEKRLEPGHKKRVAVAALVTGVV